MKMTRDRVIFELARDFANSMQQFDVYNFLHMVASFGSPFKPFSELTNDELLEYWNEHINDDGNYPITIVDKKEV